MGVRTLRSLIVIAAALLALVAWSEWASSPFVLRILNAPSSQANALFGGSLVMGDDASANLNSGPSITIEKSTNGADADAAPGAYILAGGAVDWTYEVTNTGDVDLDPVVVSDSEGVAVSCTQSALSVGEAMICTASGTAIAGQYGNTGTATGTPPVGDPVSDSDDSHYFGSVTTIRIEKLTNGSDADTVFGPYIPAGDPVDWTYWVINSGNVALTDVLVSDSEGVTVSCPKDTLDPGEPMICTASGTAVAGQYENIGTARGSPPVAGEDPECPGSPPCVWGTDPSHYYGFDPAITIEKFTNGADADAAPGPYIERHDTVTWTYEVINTGNVPLGDVSVGDSEGVAVSCPQVVLDVGEPMTCTASGIAIASQYSNTGTATGTPLDTPGGAPVGVPVWGSDDSHYFGSDPAITIEKSTNDADADAAPGPYILINQPVDWTYEVTNTGNVDLDPVVVSDSKGVGVSCPQSALAVGQAMTCTASDLATAGQYGNTGTATGTPPVGASVSDSDDSHYFGSDPGIKIKKFTNGQDADTAPGPYIPVGDPVGWTYWVINNGNVALTDVLVSDSEGVTVSCPEVTLDPGEPMICTASGTAVAGQYENIGTARGSPPVANEDPECPGSPPCVWAQDPSHYFGLDPAITIEKSTNGADADAAPGPYIPVGDPVGWAYEVTNTGNITLTKVGVMDSEGITVSCPQDVLVVSASMTCTASGIATAGQYQNTGTVTAYPPVGVPILGSDDSHYFGVQEGIDSDADGYEDAIEAFFLGTNPASACPLTGTPDDEEPDPWPPDFNDDRVINLTDVFHVLPPHFGSGVGDPDYSERRDLVPDGVINLADVFMVFPPYFGQSCTP